MMKYKEEMFNKFYKEYNKKIYNFILYKTKNEIAAEELMQESFITLYEIIKNIGNKSEDEMKKLIFTIAKNKVMAWNNKIKRRKEKFDDNIAKFYENDITNPENIINNRETSSELNEALQELTELQRNVILLIKVKGLSYKEAAKVLNKNENEIKQLLHRAKNSLKRVLEQKYPDIATRYRSYNKFNTIIAIILATTMITGIVYASYKVYECLVKMPETYTLKERDSAIDENSVTIKREDAKAKIKEYLDVLEITDYNLEDIELVKDGIYNRVSWTLGKDNKFRIDIDAETGELIKYNCLDVEMSKKNKLTEKEILKYIENKYKDLKLNEEFNMITYKRSVKASAEIIDFIYAKSEDNIYNSVIIQYVVDYNRIQNIINMDSNTEKKKINISKEKAIEILKENYKVDSIESIELDVETNIVENDVDNIDYAIENEIDMNLNINEKIISFNWRIRFNEVNEIYIDIETGEITATTILNYQELKRVEE